MKRSKVDILFISLAITWLILLIGFGISSPQDFCNPCDYPLQPGEVMRVTTLTASTPELLNSEVEEFVADSTRVVKVDRTKFPEKVTVWYIDHVELDETPITLFEVR